MKLIIGLAVAAAVATGALLIERARHDATRSAWATERASLKAQYDAERARRADVALEVERVYIPKVEYIRGETRTITKEVPIYVTVENDAHCGALPVGFERLHDDTARGRDGLPAARAAADPDGAAAAAALTPLFLSDVGRALAGNYGACRENAERLTALQAWVKRVSAQGAP